LRILDNLFELPDAGIRIRERFLARDRFFFERADPVRVAALAFALAFAAREPDGVARFRSRLGHARADAPTRDAAAFGRRCNAVGCAAAISVPVGDLDPYFLNCLTLRN
jgi:hypothetical protein